MQTKTIEGTFDEKYIKYKSNGNEKLWIEQNLNKIRPHLGYMADDLR